MRNRIIIAAILAVFMGLVAGLWRVSLGDDFKTVHESKPRIIMGPAFVDDGGAREPVKCEFEEPLKYLNFIMHWYDTNEEMYADYVLLADPAEEEEIWGWSNCIWQPDDSWAACDIYVVKPDYVHADMNVDTLGHEALHAACGDYHEE